MLNYIPVYYTAMEDVGACLEEARHARVHEQDPVKCYTNARKAWDLHHPDCGPDPSCDTCRQIWYELAIAAYYANAADDGLWAINQLLLDVNGDADDKAEMKDNLRYYVSPPRGLSVVRAVSEDADRCGDNNTAGAGKWWATNPSIVYVEAIGFLVSCRMINYTRDPETHRFTIYHPQRRIQSYIRLLLYDATWSSVLGSVDIKDGPRHRYLGAPCQGLEDARLFWRRDGCLWAMCTVPDALESGANCMAAVCLGSRAYMLRVLRDPKVKEMQALAIWTLRGPVDGRVEKNWMPLTFGVIYSMQPLRILKPRLNAYFADTDEDIGDDVCRLLSCGPEVHRETLSVDLSQCRGSAATTFHAESGNERVLVVTHEVGPRYFYYHRMVLLCGETRRLLGVSQPFVFRKASSIEFCAGVVVVGGRVYFSVGHQDCKAVVYCMSLMDALQYVYSFPLR